MFFELEDQQYEDCKKIKEMLNGLNRRFLAHSDGYAEIIMIKLEKIKELYFH